MVVNAKEMIRQEGGGEIWVDILRFKIKWLVKASLKR